MKKESLNEIRTRGINILNEKLGPVYTIRFLQDLSEGSGDYTKDRHKWLDNLSLDQVIDQIK